MPDYGLKISKPSYLATTNELNELSFSSGKNVLRLYKKYPTAVTLDGNGDGVASVTHGLGYKPAIFSFLQATAVKPSDLATEFEGSYFTKNGNLHPWLFSHKNGDSTTNYYDYTNSSSIVHTITNLPASTTHSLISLAFINPVNDFSTNKVTTIDNYGLRISKPGSDVTQDKMYETAFSSDFRPLRLVLNGEYTFNLDAYNTPNGQDVQTFDIEHGLSYPPFCLVYVRSAQNDGNLWRYEPRIYTNVVESALIASYDSFIITDSPSRLRLSCWRWAQDLGFPFGVQSFPAEDVYFKYFIFDEPLNSI